MCVTSNFHGCAILIQQHDGKQRQQFATKGGRVLSGQGEQGGATHFGDEVSNRIGLPIFTN